MPDFLYFEIVHTSISISPWVLFRVLLYMKSLIVVNCWHRLFEAKKAVRANYAYFWRYISFWKIPWHHFSESLSFISSSLKNAFFPPESSHKVYKLCFCKEAPYLTDWNRSQLSCATHFILLTQFNVPLNWFSSPKLLEIRAVYFSPAFTNRCAAALSSSSSMLSSLSSSMSSSQSDLALGTTDVEAVTKALVNAVNYNMQRKCLPV